MALVHRVLYPEPITSLDEYLARIGGEGLEAALQRSPEAIIEVIEASGLRGRGGAGFPTGRKWRTVASSPSPVAPTTVVVNGAEGEPGTFKDRTILRINPYQVIEGALIAARAMNADAVVFALKGTFDRELERLRAAVSEFVAAGLDEGVKLEVFEGPDEYLYGEETALLEVLEGRYPFPRVAPPYRRGAEEGDPVDEVGPPALVDNVETIANVPRILHRGAEWFRTEGTADSPGTIVVTVMGAVRHAGVGEVPMGTPLREAIELVGGGPKPGHTIRAVLPGTAQAFIPASRLDTPLSYEDMAKAGSGLGSAGFMVYDEDDDLASVAAGVSRFLAVESCGQCVPCKQDGIILSDALARVCANAPEERDHLEIKKRAGTVADRARCYLATQHQVVITSFLDEFADDLEAHVTGKAEPVEPALIAELLDIEEGRAILNVRQRDKQPDWSHDAEWSGKVPAELFADKRVPHPLDD